MKVPDDYIKKIQNYFHSFDLELQKLLVISSLRMRLIMAMELGNGLIWNPENIGQSGTILMQ